MFSAQTSLIRFRLSRRAEIDFAGHQPSVPRPSELLQDVPHHQLGFAASVSLGVVEEIDAALVSFDHERLGNVVTNLVAERDPGPKGKLAHLNTSTAESTIVHWYSIAPFSVVAQPENRGDIAPTFVLERETPTLPHPRSVGRKSRRGERDTTSLAGSRRI